VSKDKYFEGIGRRKTSTARVRIYSGEKASTINDKAIDDYFVSIKDVDKEVKKPLFVVNLQDKYYFTAKVAGGGLNSQVDAIKLGISRALYSMDETLKPVLRKEGLVTRDPRAVERKLLYKV